MAGMPYPPIVCTVCFVGALLALASGKAERRQVHPLEIALLAFLVQFLLWQAARPSGDCCTPLKFATRLQNIFPNFVKDYFSLSD